MQSDEQIQKQKEQIWNFFKNQNIPGITIVNNQKHPQDDFKPNQKQNFDGNQNQGFSIFERINQSQRQDLKNKGSFYKDQK